MTTIPQLTKELEEAYKDIRYYKNRIENLNGKLQQKENIIKEVRKHIEKTIQFEKNCGFNYWNYDGGVDEYIEMVAKTLEILDKENS